MELGEGIRVFDIRSHPHVDYGVISIDEVTSRGNSGGPLLNSRGLIIGTYFALAKLKNSEPIGLVQPIEIHCKLVFECSGIEPKITTTESSEMFSEKGNE